MRPLNASVFLGVHKLRRLENTDYALQIRISEKTNMGIISTDRIVGSGAIVLLSPTRYASKS